MTMSKKKTLTTTLPLDELAEFDRVCDRRSLSRSQALREAIRWYIGAMRSLPPAEEPSPDEIEAIRRGKEQIARGEYIRLEDLQRELGLPTE
jgi:metal-responsive CopG/Arc/MetJ family transcriptional regulator